MNEQFFKVDFLETLQSARAEWESLLAKVGESNMLRPGVAGEWSVKDIICHITWFEREMVGVLKARALIGSDLWNHPQGQRNATIFEENRHRSLDEVLAEARQVYQGLYEALQSVSDEDLNNPGHFENMPPDWSPGKLIAENSYEHYRAHAPSIRAWLNKNLHYQLVDISHTIENGLITYKGLPAPIICDYWSREYSRQFYSAETEFQIGKIEMVANTGTYLDSPFHRYAGGKDLSELPLSALANLEGLVIRAPIELDRAIDASIFTGIELRGKAILIHTGWDAHWNTDQYFDGHPYLTRDAAKFLSDSGVALVGIDSLNIDDTADGTRPAHTILLGADIPIVEHLCHLEQLPDKGFNFFAVPVKVKGFGSFPVRAFGMITQPPH